MIKSVPFLSAMVKLKTPAVLNDDVSVACEAHKDWDFPANMQCVVTGWGVTVEGVPKLLYQNLLFLSFC